MFKRQRHESEAGFMAELPDRHGGVFCCPLWLALSGLAVGAAALDESQGQPPADV